MKRKRTEGDTAHELQAVTRDAKRKKEREAAERKKKQRDEDMKNL